MCLVFVCSGTRARLLLLCTLHSWNLTSVLATKGGRGEGMVLCVPVVWISARSLCERRYCFVKAQTDREEGEEEEG